METLKSQHGRRLPQDVKDFGEGNAWGAHLALALTAGPKGKVGLPGHLPGAAACPQLPPLAGG